MAGKKAEPLQVVHPDSAGIDVGERDGATLASFGTVVARRTRAPSSASLRGNWRGEHLFALQQALARHDMLQGQIEACETRIDAELDGQAPHGAANEPSPARRARESVLRERLHRMLGADLTAIPTVGVETALTVAAEVGGDLSRFARLTSARGWAWRRERASAATSAWAVRRRDRPMSARHCAWRRAPPATARPPSGRRIVGASRAWTPPKRSRPPPITGAADIRHADPWRAIRRAGSGDDGNGAPRPPDQEPAASSAALRLGARAGRTSRLKAGILPPGISGLSVCSMQVCRICLSATQ